MATHPPARNAAILRTRRSRVGHRRWQCLLPPRTAWEINLEHGADRRFLGISGHQTQPVGDGGGLDLTGTPLLRGLPIRLPSLRK
jgi:hypothetical protein